jgi:hypothetical protein
LITLDADGTRQVAGRPASIPCCIDWLPDGRLLVVSGDRLPRREPDGTMVTHAELAQLEHIVTAQWPNDFRTPTGQVLAVQVTVPSARSVTAG